MILMKKLGSWQLVDDSEYQHYVDVLFDKVQPKQLATIQELVMTTTYPIKEGEVVYVVEGKKIRAFSIDGELTCEQLIDMGFETFQGYELEKKQDAMLLIRRDK